jgi:hypothetical protein
MTGGGAVTTGAPDRSETSNTAMIAAGWRMDDQGHRYRIGLPFGDHQSGGPVNAARRTSFWDRVVDFGRGVVSWVVPIRRDTPCGRTTDRADFNGESQHRLSQSARRRPLPT